jgi:hypothetical protein
MLELKTKWFTNTLAKKSMLNDDFIQCSDNKRLYVVSYGNITSSGKNTYNVVLKDSDNKVLEEHSNLYLDAITKLIIGYNQKGKANKDESESAKKNAKVSNNLCEEYKRLEANLKKAILAFNDFKVANNITTLQDASEAQDKAQKARREEKQKTRREEVAILKRIATLRKWAKETKRLDLLQSLNEKILEM